MICQNHVLLFNRLVNDTIQTQAKIQISQNYFEKSSERATIFNFILKLTEHSDIEQKYSFQ